MKQYQNSLNKKLKNNLLKGKKIKANKVSSSDHNPEIINNSPNHETHSSETKSTTFNFNDIKKEAPKLPVNQPIEEDDSDVIEIDEAENKEKQKSKNTIFLDNTSTSSTATQPSTNSIAPKSIKSLESSNDFEENIQTEEDFSNITDLHIISVLSHKKNANNATMCDCLTDKAKIVTIPAKQLKKINKVAYLQYLESQIINPF